MRSTHPRYFEFLKIKGRTIFGHFSNLFGYNLCMSLTKVMMRLGIVMSKNSEEMRDGDSGGFCQVSPNLSRVTSQLHPFLITQKLLNHFSLISRLLITQNFIRSITLLNIHLNYAHFSSVKNPMGEGKSISW